MKNLCFLFIASLLFVTAQAQKIQIRTISGGILTYGDQAQLTTADSATHTIITVSLSANTAGIFEVSVAGVDSAGNAVTGSLLQRYNKKSGTLTLGSPSVQIATVVDASLGTSTWSTGVSSNQFIVAVKGKLGIHVRWRCLIKQVFP